MRILSGGRTPIGGDGGAELEGIRYSVRTPATGRTRIEKAGTMNIEAAPISLAGSTLGDIMRTHQVVTVGGMAV
jgi:hypothetical protein